MKRWLRRSMTLPLIVLGGAVVLPLTPFLLVFTVIIDVVRRSRLALSRALVFVCAYFIWEFGGLFGLFWIWIATGGGLAFGLYRRANAQMQSLWASSIYRAFEIVYGLRTEVHGDAILPGAGPFIVFVRHASSADTMLPIWLLAYQCGYELRYVLKAELLYDPCLDVCGQRLPNCYVQRGQGEAATGVSRIRGLLQGMRSTDAIVIYPEGTRFTPEKRERAIKRLAERGPSVALSLAESLHRTLSPLRAGPLALLEQNDGAHLVVIGHTGLEAAGSFGDLTSGGPIGSTVRLDVTVVPFSQIPRDPDGQAELLAKLWMSVDRVIIQHSAEPAAREGGPR